MASQWFSLDTLVSSNIKTDHHDITESGVKHHASNQTITFQWLCNLPPIAHHFYLYDLLFVNCSPKNKAKLKVIKANQSSYLGQSWLSWSRLAILVKTSYIGQGWLFWSKLAILVKADYLGQGWLSQSRLAILVKAGYLGQGWLSWSKLAI